MTPGLQEGIAGYEAISGHDAFTDEGLSTTNRVAGVLFAGIGEFGKLGKLGKGMRTGNATIKWPSGTVSNAARLLDQGATEATVSSRAEAEELFLGKYQGDGYTNASGMTGPEVKEYYGQKAGTYHWDDELDANGRVVGHGEDNPDGELPHLQIHTYDGDIIRIFYKP